MAELARVEEALTKRAAQLHDARGAVLAHDEGGGALVEALGGGHDQHVPLAHVQPGLVRARIRVGLRARVGVKG